MSASCGTVVAYSFQRRFAEPIVAGTKGGTIRAHRLRRHARPGEELQLYVGMRTKHCRLVARKICCASTPIVIDFAALLVRWPAIDRRFSRIDELNAFAVFDGFPNFDEMVRFWAATHPEGQPVDGFYGWHICWHLEPPSGR